MNKYQYALVLSRCNYVDLTDFKNLSKRTFIIHEWDPSISYNKYVSDKGENESGVRITTYKIDKQKIGGWVPIMRYSNNKWHSLRQQRDFFVDNLTLNSIMMPAHLFFQNQQELIDWMGIDNYANAMVELL